MRLCGQDLHFGLLRHVYGSQHRMASGAAQVSCEAAKVGVSAAPSLLKFQLSCVTRRVDIYFRTAFSSIPRPRLC